MTLAELRWFIRRHTQDGGSSPLVAVTPEAFARLAIEIAVHGREEHLAVSLLDASSASIDDATVLALPRDIDFVDTGLDLRSLG